MLGEKSFHEHTSVKKIRVSCSSARLFSFRKLQLHEVQNEMRNLDKNKATGWDSISPSILQMGDEGLAKSLTNLYNKCIELKQWSHEWKMGEWIPAFKSENKYDRNNYRPITILITIDKVFESLLARQITDYYGPVLYYKSTAYTKLHSCEYSFLSLTEDWKAALDKKSCMGIFSTDMSKAFDSLQPSLLIQKFKAYGFLESALNIMRTFFDNRRNRVKLVSSCTVSEWKDVVRGCPQGSSFGPLLWNIFQNDMAMMVRNPNLHVYADDHQLYKVGKQIKCIESELSVETELASDWYKENFLKPNYIKNARQ